MSNLFLKYKQSTKTTLTREKTKIQKIQLKKLSYYFLSVFCVLIYFSSEYVDKDNKDVKNAKSEYQTYIDSVSSAYKLVLKQAEGTLAFDNYKNILDKKQVSKAAYFKAKKENRVFGFNDIWQFLYEFGPAFCFFIAFLCLLFRSFYFESKNIGIKFLIISMLSLLCFKFYWIFQPFQDLSKISYYIMTIFTVSLIVLAVWLITKYEEHYINVLKSKYLNLVKFTFNNTKEERRKEMLSILSEAEKE
tara:strand:- start:268 stop:1008 length:741 start_codon:yes stop_codon:yes gene_type:complete